MKRIFMVMAGLFVLILLLYVALGCLVYCYYEPNILSLTAAAELEASRQDGWDMAIAEIEEECRRIEETQRKELYRLRQAVKIEERRNSQLKNDFRGRSSRWSREWKLRTEERLAQAQRALAELEGPKSDPKLKAKIRMLRERLEALRVRKQSFQAMLDRLNLMIEWRNRLKIWPLPIIDRFVNNDSTGEK